MPTGTVKWQCRTMCLNKFFMGKVNIFKLSPPLVFSNSRTITFEHSNYFWKLKQQQTRELKNFFLLWQSSTFYKKAKDEKNWKSKVIVCSDLLTALVALSLLFKPLSCNFTILKRPECHWCETSWPTQLFPIIFLVKTKYFFGCNPEFRIFRMLCYKV